MSVAPASLSEGSIVADTYQVTRLLGTGGMGEVWLADHRRLPGKQVAIKVLHLGRDDVSTDALARFQREAQVATRIGHPNIVEVHDFNQLPSGAPYLVLEYLQGESLASRLRYGTLPLDEISSIVRQLGSALSASHGKGVIHRDLKPDNIFLCPGPLGTVVKVLDFGISKLVDGSTLQTGDQLLVGTPQYMAPEQATGRNSTVGPQTDVFALGCITYEMLVGEPPFVAESAVQTLYRIAHEPHQPVLERRGDLPVAMAAAVEAALKKNASERTADAAKFASDFTGTKVEWVPPKPVEGRSGSPSGSPAGVATPGGTAIVASMLAKTSPATPLAMAAPPLPTPLLDTPLGDRQPYSVTSSTAPKGFRWVMVATPVVAALVLAVVGFTVVSSNSGHVDALPGLEVVAEKPDDDAPPPPTGGVLPQQPVPTPPEMPKDAPVKVAANTATKPSSDDEPKVVMPSRKASTASEEPKLGSLSDAIARAGAGEGETPKAPGESSPAAAVEEKPAPPPTSAAPRSAGEDVAALDEAWKAGKYETVVELARGLKSRLGDDKATADRVALLHVQANCALGNVSAARLLLPTLAATDVGSAMTWCREKGTEL